MKIFAVIPAYNEEPVIGEVIEKVKNFVDRVVVIDDGSNDQTARVASDKGATVLSHLINRGQGAALRTGTEYALDCQADIIVHFDADGQQNPQEIKKLIEPVARGDADVVLGSRFLTRNNKMPLLRFLILKGGVLFTWFFSGLKLTDTHNGFRVLSRKAAQKINITQDKMAHASEIIDEIARHDLKFLEMAVSVRYTPYSQNKGQKNFGFLKIVRDFLLGKFLGR